MLIFKRTASKDATEASAVIRIGKDIVIRVLEVRARSARIAIEAPDDVPVHREEVYRAMTQSGSVVRSLAVDTVSKSAP